MVDVGLNPQTHASWWGFSIQACLHKSFVVLAFTIIESVDSISRDGPDTPIYVNNTKSLKKLSPGKVLSLQRDIIFIFV